MSANRNSSSFSSCICKTNQAVGSAVQALEQLTKTKFPPADSVMHGYLHFEAMSSHSYDFSCVCCGDHPPIVIMDLHKKGAFHQTGKYFFSYSINAFPWSLSFMHLWSSYENVLQWVTSKAHLMTTKGKWIWRTSGILFPTNILPLVFWQVIYICFIFDIHYI